MNSGPFPSRTGRGAAAFAGALVALTITIPALAQSEGGFFGEVVEEPVQEALPEGHPCAGLDASGCAGRAAELSAELDGLTARIDALVSEAAAERARADALSGDLAARAADAAAAKARADALEAAAAATLEVGDDHPCSGLTADECAARAASDAARLAELEAEVGELETRARAALRYKSLADASATEIERLTGELATCSSEEACTGDAAYLEAQQALADTEAALATRTAELSRITAARDAALVEFTASETELAAAEAELSAVRGQLAGLETAIAALERENKRLAEELTAQRDLPRIQAALAALPCGQEVTTLDPGTTVPVLAGSAEEAARIGEELGSIGGGITFEISTVEGIPGAGCPAMIAPGWAALRWEGEPPEVLGSIVSAGDADVLLAKMPDAAFCAELAGALTGRAARFWVRDAGALAVCDVRRRDIDRTLNPRGAAALLLLPVEPAATVGGG